MRAYSYMRFSSQKQRKGDSIRRQIELRDSWLNKKGIPLDNSLVMTDRASSAFRGKNAEVGALATFMKAVEGGQVPRGSILIVENLDRLTREAVPEAVEKFLAIINAGIKIVTLIPEVEFTKATMDMVQLILAIVELGRGFSESFAKSERSRANWIKRRKLAETQLLTEAVPSWIRVVEGKAVLDFEKAAIVRRVFDLSINGTGTATIANLFNKEGVPCIGKGTNWYDAVVQKLLRNRACLGECHPCSVNKEGKRVPTGQVIKDHFPPVVSEEIFARAARALDSRKAKSCGKGGSNGDNLFCGLVKSPSEQVYYYALRRGMQFLRLATGRKGEDYLPSINYTTFEKMMLIVIRELKIDLTESDVDLDGMEARYTDLLRRIANVKKGIREKGLDSLLDMLAEMEAEEKVLLRELEIARIPKENQLAHTQGLIAELEKGDNPEARRAVRQQLTLIVKNVEVVSITGKKCQPEKTYHFRIEFTNGYSRDLIYSTDRQGEVKGKITVVGWVGQDAVGV